MFLRDCELNIDLVVAAPIERTSPEDIWVNGLKSGVLPKPLYDLYCKTGFLSFGAAPPFLKDQESILFSYFSLILRSIFEALQDADNQLIVFEKAQNLTYDYGKKIRGEKWDPDASAIARRSFRDLLTALHSSLDALADVMAIFLPGMVKGLTVGRAQFIRIESWLARPLPAFVGNVMTPMDFFLRRLYEDIRPIVLAAAPEKEWLPFMISCGTRHHISGSQSSVPWAFMTRQASFMNSYLGSGRTFGNGELPLKVVRGIHIWHNNSRKSLSRWT